MAKQAKKPGVPEFEVGLRLGSTQHVLDVLMRLIKPLQEESARMREELDETKAVLAEFKDWYRDFQADLGETERPASRRSSDDD